jgi:Uma2 family endonuclease
MALQPVPVMTFQDWLEAERVEPEGRTEYVAGEVFAMAGGSEAHNLIVVNIARELSLALKRRPCRVYPSDMKVHIASAEAGVYPDVMVICGERHFHDNRRDLVTNPGLIVEVLSDSTEAYDRGLKFANYREIESLQTYLLISQDRVAVDLYQRQADNSWNLESFAHLEDVIPLPGIDTSLAMAEVYDKVELT